MSLVRKETISPRKNESIDYPLSLNHVVDFVKLDEELKPNDNLMVFHTQQQKQFWTTSEIEYQEQDIVDNFPKLDEDSKTIINSILLFFTVADKMVIGNLMTLIEGIPYKAANYFFMMQGYIESVHDMTYEKSILLYYNNNEKLMEDKKLLDSIISTAEEYPEEVFDFDNYDSSIYSTRSPDEQRIFQAVALKINLMNRWKNKKSLIHNLVAFFIMENLSFNALFALINTFKEYNKGLRYLIDINEFVARDERIHAEFGLYIYKHCIKNKLPVDEFMFILKEISEIEIKFLEILLPENVKINNRGVEDYVEYIKAYSNGITQELNYEPLYKDVDLTKCESFNTPGLKNKHNFFERTGTYVIDNKPLDMNIILDLF